MNTNVFWFIDFHDDCDRAAYEKCSFDFLSLFFGSSNPHYISFPFCLSSKGKLFLLFINFSCSAAHQHYLIPFSMVFGVFLLSQVFLFFCNIKKSPINGSIIIIFCPRFFFCLFGNIGFCPKHYSFSFFDIIIFIIPSFLVIKIKTHSITSSVTYLTLDNDCIFQIFFIFILSKSS